MDLYDLYISFPQLCTSPRWFRGHLFIKVLCDFSWEDMNKIPVHPRYDTDDRPKGRFQVVLASFMSQLTSFLTQSRVILQKKKGTLIEKMPYQIGLWANLCTFSWLWLCQRVQLTMGVAISWLVILGAIRKQAGQATRNRPNRTTPPWLLLQFSASRSLTWLPLLMDCGGDM